MGFEDVVPAPAWSVPSGEAFALCPDLVISGPAEIAGYLAQVIGDGARVGPGGAIRLELAPGPGTNPLDHDLPPTIDADSGGEGYELEVAATGITLRAHTPTGLFRGVQTLRQLLPVGDNLVPGGRIVDAPRFAYRGVMLDVARHFFDIAAVKRLIEHAALYKVNHLHLHLTDDQGWRIAIDSWPRLATYGGGTEVGDGPGGHFSTEDYREIVAHAARHFMTVVPEVDLPGHTNAALASYPELSAGGEAPPRYTGIEVGFSALRARDDTTHRFLDDVFRELAALTPGPYLHLGGDEAFTLSREDYADLVIQAQEIVVAHGKTPIGWHEIAGAKLAPTTVLQYWGTTRQAPDLLAAGAKVIMSPANRAYLDMKYQEGTALGLEWAGMTTLADAYDWDPTTCVDGLDPAAVIGVESPLWTETVKSVADLDHLLFPRLVAIAEIGWSPAATHDWASFRARLAAQAPRWDALGIAYARDAL